MTLQTIVNNKLTKITGEILEVNSEFFTLDLQGIPTRFYFDCQTRIGESPENGKFSILYIG